MNLNLEKLEGILKLIEKDKVTYTEVAKFFATLLKVVKEMNKAFIEDVKKHKFEVVERLSSYQIKLGKIESSLPALIERMRVEFGGFESRYAMQEKKLQVELEKTRKMLESIAKIAAAKNALSDRIDEIESQILSEQDIAKALVKYGTQVRDALERLIGDERLDKSAVKGIEEIEKDIRSIWEELKKGKTTMKVVGSGLNGGKIVKMYDLSSQLNSVLKTFSIPATWRVISVHSSASPHILRETTDYTWTQTSITFTSEINADTTLSTGQTLIIVYAEA